jgi:hypothetical protein
MIFDHDQQFYAYYDTIEETGEIIYCGKGTKYRSNIDISPLRNKKYNNIQKNHKIIRTRIPTLDEDLALKLEDWLMEYYHTWVDDPLATEHACNIDGPGTNNGCKSRSQETRNKIGKSQKGIKRSEEIKQKLKKPKSNEHKRKLRIAQTGKKQPDIVLLKLRKPVIQLNLDGTETGNIYSSIFEVTQLTGISNISRCCLGKRKQAGGFIWKHLQDWHKDMQIVPIEQFFIVQYDKQLNYINKFDSIQDIAKILGFKQNNILQCLLKKHKTAYGFIWNKINKKDFIESENK